MSASDWEDFDRDIQALREAFDVCHYPDEPGFEECPFERDLHRQKEQRAEKVYQRYLGCLESSKRALAEASEVDARLRELSLDTDEDRRLCKDLRLRRNQYQQQARLCKERAAQARGALREAAQKVYPGTKPRRV